MENKIQDLLKKRRDKLKEYNTTDSKSWKKRLKKLELDIIEIKVKIEKLRKQYE